MALTEAVRSRANILRGNMSAEQRQLKRNGLLAVAQLAEQVGISKLHAYKLFHEVQQPDAVFDAEDIKSLTADLQEVVTALQPVLADIALMESFGDEVNGISNANNAIAAEGVDEDNQTVVDRFPSRYK